MPSNTRLDPADFDSLGDTLWDLTPDGNIWRE